MTTKLSITALTIALLAATSLPAQAQWGMKLPGNIRLPANIDIPGLSTQPEISRVEGCYEHPNWQVEFCSVPKLLRMHCPALPAEQGVLISRIDPNGPAAMFYDLQVGDIVVTADGEAVFGMASLPESPGANLMVLRGGEVIQVDARAVSPVDSIAKQSPRPMNPAMPQGQLGTSATAYSSGNESVSVAQNGDQITLEMSLPQLQSAPIRFQGTRQQIMRDVQDSKLSPAARQRVLQAIR